MDETDVTRRTTCARPRETKASGEIVEAGILRVLRLARAMAAEDDAHYPQPHDYLPAELIAELISMNENWRTLEYETPTSTIVLRRLWRLEREGRVWFWEGGRRDYRWALADEIEQGQR